VISLALGGRAVATRSRAVRKAVRIPRSMGSAALALAYVANGRFDAFVQQGGLSAWDVAAAGLIAERAGATVTDFDGGRWFDEARGPRALGLLAAPPVHHRALLDLVRVPSSGA
jgi:fructose-1,6-bisphosphatase/inositol monophosphatase family enzyme